MRGPFEEDDLKEEDDLFAGRDGEYEDIDHNRKDEEAESDYFNQDDFGDDFDNW